MEIKHAPLPWFESYTKLPDGMYAHVIYNHEQHIAQMSWYSVKIDEHTTGTSREVNAELIVKAVNNHEQLVKTLKLINNNSLLAINMSQSGTQFDPISYFNQFFEETKAILSQLESK